MTTGVPALDISGRQPKERRWLKLFVEFITELRIQSKEVSATDERGSPLDLWGSQRMFLEQVAEGLEREVRTFYCLKSRQLGITTVSLAIDLFWLAMHPMMKGALVCDTEMNKASFRRTLQLYHKSLKREFIGNNFRKVKDNDAYMLFSNGSQLDFLVAGTRKDNWGEGKGYTFVHSTETAAYGSAAGLASFREALAEANPDRLFIYESTAKGKNHWYSMYLEGERDTLTKKSFFIPWCSKELNSIPKRDPRFQVYGLLQPNAEERELIRLVAEQSGINLTAEQLAWKRWRDSDTSSSRADQDQNQPWTASQAFVSSGFSFFPHRQVDKMLDVIYDPEGGVGFTGYRFIMGEQFHNTIMEAVGPNDDISSVELRIWEAPHPEGTYVLGCDPAFGHNDWKDRHALTVWRGFADKLVQVAEYADDKVATHQAAWVLAYLAAIYKNCIVNIELTGGPGHAVMRELDTMRQAFRAEMNRAFVGERDWGDFLSNAQYYLWHRPDAMGAGYAYHTDMSSKIKFNVYNQLRDSLMTGALIPRSAPMLEEMLRIVQEGSTIEAHEPDKDDRVAAAVLAHMAWKDWVQPGMIQRGATYQDVMLAEAGRATPAGNTVRRIVQDFWKTRVQRLEEQEEGPQTSLALFMEERGLYD
ncbi:MAG: hypothetical protein KGL39_29450 [Patescibacteria group bacterium]|nr:hypothetical protein [Patescibacteria group bacterium]